MKTTIVYKGINHYLSEVDPGSVTLKTVSGDKVHRQHVAGTGHEGDPDEYGYTDWVSLALPEFGQVLRENGFDRKSAAALFDVFFETHKEEVA